ncbi:MAG: hypothetical protein DSZ29_02235 [Aquificaceae bacterium]|nr:MAG: hypothetical protein DSZ29_02235 [Aquificaceae bacterium]
MTAEILKRITVEADKCGGRPCIRNMRIRVKDILDMLASGMSQKEILEDYPYLEADDITAVLMYAARQFDHPILKAA